MDVFVSWQAMVALAVASTKGSSPGLQRCVLAIFALYHALVIAGSWSDGDLQFTSPATHFHVGFIVVGDMLALRRCPQCIASCFKQSTRMQRSLCSSPLGECAFSASALLPQPPPWRTIRFHVRDLE